MEELAIKIRIYDRQYPMKVQATDEASVRKAGELINNQIKAYRDKFGITDIQDLLAMVAFDCLVDSLKIKKTVEEDQQLIEKNVDSMIQLIDRVLA
ncbi:MAG: cell division protein ZapA [Candidatus Amoebophilus sp. 36-38]|nr:MAG: cell division protein ZapA [Candidatus Amoebophilus sp. 36-38]